MIKTYFLDDIKDIKLIQWLRSKTNMSAVVREALYYYMDHKALNKEETKSTNNINTLNSLMKFNKK